MAASCQEQLLPERILVRSKADELPCGDLFRLLESVVPARFTPFKAAANEGEGEILLQREQDSASVSGPSECSSLRLSGRGSSSAGGDPVTLKVRFADNRNVPFPFRGRSLSAKVAVEATLPLLNGSETVLAASERGALWTVSEASGVKRFRSALPLPTIPAEGSLFDVLNGERFVEMLPLLHWLREACSRGAYHPPSLRACFIFDDPNLHWPSYGFVNFRQMASHAASRNYHVCFATIPLDTWFTHAETAALFRVHPDRLSLAVHGNNHIRLELARNYTPQQRTALLRQAIERISRLERKTGFRVSRVMVPPHGACSEEMLEELPQSGFEAACISHGSLRAHNRTRAWTRSLGYHPVEFVGGCPVLPRWGLAGNTINTILLAAFLGQPLILRGHHQDLKDGIERLDELADFINALGAVSWSSLTDLSRGSYQWRMEGDLLKLKPLGLRSEVRRHPRAARLTIENPPRLGGTSWKVSAVDGAAFTVLPGDCIHLPPCARTSLSLSANVPAPMTDAAAGAPFAATAFLRRLLTEGRDRLLS